MEMCLSLGGTPSKAGSGCYPLSGRSMAGGGALSRSVSPSSPTYFAKPPSLSRMEGRARYSPDYADIDMIVTRTRRTHEHRRRGVEMPSASPST
jgi:hypothetical protein